MRGDGEWVEYTIPKFGPNRRLTDSYRHQGAYAGKEQDEALTRELEFKNTLPKPTMPKA